MVHEEEAPTKRSVTFATLVDQSSGAVTSTAVTAKGASDKFAVTKMAEWLDRCGSKRVVLTTDNENAARALARGVKAKTTVEVVLRCRPKGSSASLASGENNQTHIAGGVRTILAELEALCKYKVPIT